MFMAENERNVSDEEKKIIISIVSEDKLRCAILEELYNSDSFVRTSDIYERVEEKLGGSGRTQSYYLKLLRNLERGGLVRGVKSEIDRKNLYWSITKLGREVVEEIFQSRQ